MQYAAINPSNSKYGSQTQSTGMTMNSSQQTPSEPSMMSSAAMNNSNRQQQQMAAQNSRNQQQKGSSAQPIPPRAGGNLSPLDRLKMIQAQFKA